MNGTDTNGRQETIRLPRPDDWHLHLRDGAALSVTVPATARAFGRAIVMPNLVPPVTDAARLEAYRARVLAALPPGSDFEPLMTLYLTEATTPAVLAEARGAGAVAVKLYPAGATTHSEAGVRSVDRVMEALEWMAEAGMPLLVHGEVVAPEVDVFDREARFIDTVLAPLVARLPEHRLVLEHVTTREAGPRVGATITAHHLLLNRNALFEGGLRPHHYCLPVLKREEHRQALLEAATGGDPSFFLGTDSAPHPRSGKESACGCAGVFTAHAALALYAEAFDSMGRLDALPGFAWAHGADFHRLPRNEGAVRLVRREVPVPAALPWNGDELVPFRAGGQVGWAVEPEGGERGA